MCLALAARVVSVNDGEGEVMIDGRLRRVSFVALPDARPDEHVLVSLGMAVERISEYEARQIGAAWDELAQLQVTGEKDDGGHE